MASPDPVAQEPNKTPDARARAPGPDRHTLVLAAVLLAEDGWTDQEIASYLGVSRRTLARWKTRDDLRLARDALYLLQVRKYHRRSLRGQWPFWPADAGPRSPDEWERV